MKISDSYNTLVFDCDGVVLNSNTIKTNAFRDVTLQFGESASASFMTFHKKNGGVSRYKKFEHFLEVVLPGCAPEFFIRDKHEILCDLTAQFAKEIRTGLLQCEVAKGLTILREAMPNTRWLVVSGADQTELRELFYQRGMSHYFDAGIFRSPKNKLTIVEGLIKSGQIHLPALFLGDSLLDYEVSKAFGLDFIFVHEWTELAEWRHFCQQNNIQTIPSISHLSGIQKNESFVGVLGE